MSSSSKSAGTGADVSTVGTRTWSNPGNIISNNATRASVTGDSGNFSDYSHYLRASNFGFTIPTGSTINGIVVSIDRYASNNSSPYPCIKDYRVSIVTASASVGTTNKGKTDTLWPTSEAAVTYGASDNLWDLAWTAENINDTDFGVVLEVIIVNNNEIMSPTAYVDYISIEVTYTEAASGPALLKTANGLVKASVKTLRSGVLIASGKTWNGVA